MKDIPSVYSYPTQAFDGLLEHIFSVHHCTRVDFMAGLRGHYSSECMVLAYREALRRHGLPFEEARIGYGEYWDVPAAQ